MSSSLLHIKEIVSSALAKIPVSSFQELPENKVIEISSDSSIAEAVELLSKHSIFSVPVRNPAVSASSNWSERYEGLLDYGAIILWVLEQADLSAVALAVGSAAAAGVGAGAVGALGALAVGLTGPAAVVGLSVAAVGAAIAGGVAVEKGISRDAPSAVDALGEDFYKVILTEEPFKSIKVFDLIKSYRWTPFVPVRNDDTMLTVLVLLSKYKLRSVPVVEMEEPEIKNFVTQSAVVRALSQCKGRDWFDEMAAKAIRELTFPVMDWNKVVSIDENKLVLEAFICMKESKIGGLPILETGSRKIVGNISLRDVQHLLLRPDLFAKHRSLTVKEFMEVLHMKGVVTHMMPAITCERDDTLEDIIKTMCDNNVHQIYVVDKEHHVVGIITLRDIISCFILEPPAFAHHFFNGAFKNILSSLID